MATRSSCAFISHAVRSLLGAASTQSSLNTLTAVRWCCGVTLVWTMTRACIEVVMAGDNSLVRHVAVRKGRNVQRTPLQFELMIICIFFQTSNIWMHVYIYLVMFSYKWTWLLRKKNVKFNLKLDVALASDCRKGRYLLTLSTVNMQLAGDWLLKLISLFFSVTAWGHTRHSGVTKQ